MHPKLGSAPGAERKYEKKGCRGRVTDLLAVVDGEDDEHDLSRVRGGALLVALGREREGGAVEAVHDPLHAVHRSVLGQRPLQVREHGLLDHLQVAWGGAHKSVNKE